MECPYCGNEMQEGYLQSMRPMVWSKGDLEGGIFLIDEAHGGYGGFYVTKGIFRPWRNIIPSRYCAKCGMLVTKLVLPVDKQEEEDL